MLADITGLPAPRFRVPYGVIWLVALAMEGVARLSRKPPRVPLTGVPTTSSTCCRITIAHMARTRPPPA